MLDTEFLITRTFLLVLGVGVRRKADALVDVKNAFLVCDGRPAFVSEHFVHLLQSETFCLWNLYDDQIECGTQGTWRILTNSKTNKPPRKEKV